MRSAEVPEAEAAGVYAGGGIETGRGRVATVRGVGRGSGCVGAGGVCSAGVGARWEGAALLLLDAGGCGCVPAVVAAVVVVGGVGLTMASPVRGAKKVGWGGEGGVGDGGAPGAEREGGGLCEGCAMERSKMWPWATGPWEGVCGLVALVLVLVLRCWCWCCGLWGARAEG